MWVAALNAEPLMANRISGKIIGKKRSARWRRVRITARWATASVCSTVPASRSGHAPIRPAVASTATSPPPAAALDGLLRELDLPCSLQLPARLGQEDVVQRRLMEMQ